ncbi:MAG: bifunctional phosphopantothenoylcysteine decarboxylase/phosphopantothenate--cysteine ligase CoaBC [Acidobacteriota bacterium]
MDQTDSGKVESSLILLGVTGCIAAYKSAELLRLLQKRGYTITAILTEHAQKFITPLTLAALSGRPVITEMFSSTGGDFGPGPAIDHIHLAREARALVVAPATANTLAKFANGIADDFLSTLYLATPAPVVVAPAMNVKMWNHPAVQRNVETLRARGTVIVDPDEGYLAEGYHGKGRLAELDRIVEEVEKTTYQRLDLKGETVLVTAGPTCEDIDPVRYLTNRSSGKMGYQLALAARQRGARTILVSGPTRLSPPSGVETVLVRSAQEMREQVLAHFQEATIVIKAAAVADFTPLRAATQKIKKNETGWTLELVPAPDILSEIGRMKQKQVLVGFAAETGNALEHGRQKLQRKNLDLIVVNDVSQPGAGFDSDTNVVTILSKEGRERRIDRASKLEVAHRILDEVLACRSPHG